MPDVGQGIVSSQACDRINRISARKIEICVNSMQQLVNKLLVPN